MINFGKGLREYRELHFIAYHSKIMIVVIVIDFFYL